MATSAVSAGDNPSVGKPLYLLNFRNNTLIIPVGEVERSDKNRFVFIEISAVENPQLLPLAFSVSFYKNDKIINLGGFALFPGDNPGKFIVPTQGVFKNTGKIRIELILLPEYKDTESVSVEIKNVKFVDTLTLPSQ